jgi:16S rRNA (cytidine1402-2'-O)-methyltransferase
LTAALAREATSIYFESPYRILDTLEIVATAAPEHRVVVARELTKKFAEFQARQGHQRLRLLSEQGLQR